MINPKQHHAGIVLAAGASTRMREPKALLRLPNGITLAEHQCRLLAKAGCKEVNLILGTYAEKIIAELNTGHPSSRASLGFAVASWPLSVPSPWNLDIPCWILDIQKVSSLSPTGHLATGYRPLSSFPPASCIPNPPSLPTGHWSLVTGHSPPRFFSLHTALTATRHADGLLILPVDTAGVKTETLNAVLLHAEKTNASAVRPYYKEQKGNLLWLSRQVCDELLEKYEPTTDLRLDDYIKGKTIPIEVNDSAVLNNINTPDQWQKIKPTL